ncbi:MAG: response regulator [Candidatus Parabeggiatoa sp.]|nr:response regulator [Candidatus Parabeggiatoa sp.]
MLNKPVILCVDDEQTVLESLKIELKRTFGDQYLIETAESSKEALELVKQLIDDNYELPVVISDYIMHDMKGDELLTRIHAISPATAKVMLTGQASPETVENTLQQLKLYRFLKKPWQPEDIIFTLSEAIKSYFLEKQLANKTQELERKVATFHKFVPVQFLKLLNIEEYEQIKLGLCVEKTMTIMFSDIRGFTSLSEQMTPSENFNFINSYLSQMEPIIYQHHGFIDKYIGDGIMALFPTCADDAVQAACAMLKQLLKYNQGRQRAGYQAIQIGIGLHTGPLMLGTVGDQNRMDGTVISDAVNLASRIESLTKTYGTPLLITEATFSKLTDLSQYKIRVIDYVTVKGKTETVLVYEVFDADSPESLNLKLETLADFEQGFKCFHNQQFEEARDLFEQIRQVNENDLAPLMYLNHCQTILSLTMPKSPRILIVDDTPFNIDILSRLLSKRHFDVLIAENGEMALSIVKQKKPHLILLDIMMPGMDGFETCRRLKADSQTEDIPVIFISALTDSLDKVKGFELGAVDYITKPFQRKEVLARINTHLKLNMLQKQLQAKINELEINNLDFKEKINRLVRD